jgi:hypothetical protein
MDGIIRRNHCSPTGKQLHESLIPGKFQTKESKITLGPRPELVLASGEDTRRLDRLRGHG